MRSLLLLGVVLLTGCPQPQPGCSVENCKVMIEACRVEFTGEPAALAICTGIDRPKTPLDYSPYCVAACNASPGNGQLATCIAGKAEACRGARDAGKTMDQVIQPCFDTTAKAPDKICADSCLAERKTCDAACSGGRPCDDCLRAGKPNCASLCADAGYKVCLDCSSQCGVHSVQCNDGCARQ